MPWWEGISDWWNNLTGGGDSGSSGGTQPGDPNIGDFLPPGTPGTTGPNIGDYLPGGSQYGFTPDPYYQQGGAGYSGGGSPTGGTTSLPPSQVVPGAGQTISAGGSMADTAIGGVMSALGGPAIQQILQGDPITNRIAQAGLTPSGALANITGQAQVSPQQLSNTPLGRALGLTVAGGTTVAGYLAAVGLIGAASSAASEPVLTITSGASSGAGAYATNTVTRSLSQKLISSTVAKVGVGVGTAGLIAGAVGSYPFAKFEIAESVDKIGIAMFAAMQQGEWGIVSELSQIQKDMIRGGEEVAKLPPYINVYKAASQNIEAAKISSRIFDELAQLELNAPPEESFEDKWRRFEALKSERENDRRKKEEEYYKEVDRQRKLAKAQQREEDELYWAGIFAKQDARRKRLREENEKYWADVQKQWLKARDEAMSSQLNFGLF